MARTEGLALRAARSVKVLVTNLVEDLIRPISGPLGIRMRRAWYRRRLRRCGPRLQIATGVHLDQPGWMSFGDDVCLDRNVIVTAGPAGLDAYTQVVANDRCAARPGEVVIGNRAHIAIGCIIQGHGGVEIGDAFTASAGVMIYSLSNSVRGNRNGQVETADNPVARIRTPVVIGRNVWLGLQVVVVGGVIGDDCFARPGALLTRIVPPNAVVSGNPGVVVADRFPGDAVEAPH